MSALFWMESITQKDLRDACSDLHKQAEHTRLAQELISGTLDQSVYKNYCYQLYLIADAIEAKIQFSETDLYRRHSLVQDIAECHGSSVKACPATIEYVKHINGFYNPHVHGQLNGHIYTHYLGWLYGGQMIAKNLQFPKNHLRFNDVKTCVDYVRKGLLGMIFDRDADEAKKAFEYSIKIYKELYEI